MAKEEDLIRKAQTNHYWANITDHDMDELAGKLAPFMKFREPTTPQTGPAKLDLQDIVKTKEMVGFGPEHEAVGITRYREMVEEMVRKLTNNNPILQCTPVGFPEHFKGIYYRTRNYS